jgi:hypothetical protein
MGQSNSEIKQRIIDAGYLAIDELIEVAKEPIMRQSKHGEESEVESMLAADKLKNAAQAKKMAIFDAFEILSKIEAEKQAIKDSGDNDGRDIKGTGFAERRSS